MPFVYHLCSPDFRGPTLYPLNRLQREWPDIYERERTKYDGRESVLQYRPPHLDTTWGDTVNLSALDPRLLIAARRRMGIPFSRLLERQVARIPVERLAAISCVVYDGATHWLNTSPGEDVAATPPAQEFTPFDAAGYTELTAVPDRHLQYLHRQHALGRPALGFVFIRHVLAAGPIDLTGVTLQPL